MPEDSEKQVTTIATTSASEGQDTAGDAGEIRTGDAGTSAGGADTEGEGDAGTVDDSGNAAADSVGVGHTVRYIEFTDGEGNVIGQVPLTFTDDSVQVETVSGAAVPETFYTDASSALNVIASASFILVVAIFAVFGVLCVRTLVKSFEV